MNSSSGLFTILEEGSLGGAGYKYQPKNTSAAMWLLADSIAARKYKAMRPNKKLIAKRDIPYETDYTDSAPSFCYGPLISAAESLLLEDWWCLSLFP
uniref:RES domain-containing protein n=1 Tax=Caenorhabditis tropicalis TaxID=1561998 RepID=A0A1I7V3C1_9PELO